MEEDFSKSLPLSGCLPQLFFCWLFPLLKHGYKHTLGVSDLHGILPEDSADVLADRLERQWTKEVQKKASRHQEPSLLIALLRTFWRPFALSGVLCFFEHCVFKFLNPLLVSYLVTYFSPEPAITTVQAYLCVAGIAFCSVMTAVLHHPFFFRMSRLGMQIRVATSALMYRKAVHLSNAALSQTTAGKLVNILSSDVNRFDLVFFYLHHLWLGPIQLTMFLIILYRNLGASCLLGFFVLISLAPLQGWMAKQFTKFRRVTAVLTDVRVRIMSEVISGMRIIKIHAWEHPFSEVVKESRRKEIAKILRSAYLRAFNLSFLSTSPSLVAYATFTLYAYTGHVLDPSVVYLVIPLVNFVRFTVAMYTPNCFMYGSETLVAIKRIQNFLMMEEIDSLKRSSSSSSLASDANLPVPEQIGEPLDEETVKEDAERETKEDDIDVKVTVRMNGGKEDDVIVTNNDKMDTEVRVDGIISENEKCDHDSPRPEIDHEIVMRNVSGSWKTEEQESATVLKDISLSVKPGELVAVIGPVGCGKSSLLMALLGELPVQTGEVTVSGSVGYTAQQPWVFSGTIRDNIVFGKKFLPKMYKDVLEICALKTDIAILPNGDLTFVGDHGITLSGGQRARVSLARAVYHNADVFLLDDPLSAVDTAVGRHLFDKCIKGHLKDKAVVLVTHQLQYLDAVDKIVVLKEGAMVACGTYEELQTSGLDFAALLKEYQTENPPDELSKTGSVLSIPGSLATEISSVYGDEMELEVDDGQGGAEEERAVGTVGTQVYLRFFRAGAGILGFVLYIFFNVSSQSFYAVHDWWLAQWAFAEETACAQVLNGSCLVDRIKSDYAFVESMGVDRTRYLQLLTIFLCSFMVFNIIRTYHLFIIFIKSSKHLHDKMFSAIIRSPMKFFETNSVGRILNRFSKDIGFMDEVLPFTFANFNMIAFHSLSVIITISIFNPIVFIFTVPLAIAFVMVRCFYLASSRDIKRIEGITRSPVFSHLSATLQGLITVRAFRAQNDFIRKFDTHQNLHTRAWFLFVATSRWFGVVLDSLSIIFVTVVAFSGVLLADVFNLSSSLIGLSMSYAISLTGLFQYGVRESAQVENLMTSTERVLEYTDLKPEAPLETKTKPDRDWPKQGIISFEGVSMSYEDEGPQVLKELNFCVRAKEKVGIVGRTGAGKSSLMAALMRLTEPKGVIKIDGLTIGDIGLHDLRKRISFIPQDPVLFSGTLRKNLDPFQEHGDDEIWKALEEVQMKSVVEESPQKLGMAVAEGGTNFSVGQRQLVCLARAVLHRNWILIVDEATANVDPRTDKLIQVTIRKKFKYCTVLTIAHRLNTIMDSDRVLVLDQGCVVEFDEPYILLQNEEGLFRSMVDETGKSEAAQLFEIAKTKYIQT